jgi:hypothetical protein
MKLVVKEPKSKRAGAATIKKTKLTLPKKLRFAGGHGFFDGFSVNGSHVGRVVASHRRVSVRANSSKLVEKAAYGALLRRGNIAGHKLRFKLKVTDTTGKTTKLKLTTKAKP